MKFLPFAIFTAIVVYLLIEAKRWIDNDQDDN